MLRSFPVVVVLVTLAATDASAQMVSIGTPRQSVSDSFYERFGLGWSLNGPGFNARFGGGTPGAPQFGGFTPNAGIQGGMSIGGGGFNGNLNFGAAQGVRRNFTSITPSVTTMNGYPGSITNSTQRPFVTGVVPIVGYGVVAYEPIVTGISPPPVLSPVATNLPWQSKLAEQGLKPRKSAQRDEDEEERADDRPAAGAADDGRDGLIDPLPPTRAEREQQKANEEAARNNAARAYYDKGVAAAQNGKPGVARLYFEMAANRATGTLKDEIEQRLSDR